MSTKPLTTLKLLLVGESSVGKSSMLHRFIDEVFNEEQTQTIGVEFGAKVVSLNGQRVKLQVWDTAGQERYRSVTRSYYRGAVGALIVYDITNKETFERVPQWLQDVRQLCGPDTTVMLIGNKTDLVLGNSERRQVAHTEASVFAQENGIMHLETSAQSGEFVPEAFLRVAKNTLQRMGNSSSGASGNGGGGQSGRRNGSGGGGLTPANASNNNNRNTNGEESKDDLENAAHDSIRSPNNTVRLNEHNNNNGGDDEEQGGASSTYCSKC